MRPTAIQLFHMLRDTKRGMAVVFNGDGVAEKRVPYKRDDAERYPHWVAMGMERGPRR